MAETTQSRRAKVLIVEDDSVLRKALAIILTQLGYAPVLAATVAEGLEKLDGQEFALLDLNLPDGLGTLVLQRIRDEKRPIRVAIVSGTTDEALFDSACQLQPELILRKPIDLDVLMKWMGSPKGTDNSKR